MVVSLLSPSGARHLSVLGYLSRHCRHSSLRTLGSVSRDNAHTSYGARLLPRRAVLFCHMSPAVCRHNGRCCPPINQCVSMRALSEYAGRGVVLTKRANRAPYGVADARRVLLARRPEKSPGQGTLFPEARFTAKDSVESIARVWRISGPLCRGRSGSAASRVCRPTVRARTTTL